MINEQQGNRPFRIDQHLQSQPHEDFRQTSPIEEISQIPDSQLEEDVGETFWRQMKAVAFKFWLVLFPVNAEQKINYLRNWDLWGPYLQGVFYLLVIGTDDRFMVVLRTLFFGAALVNFNIRSIGGSISYFQGLSILGYSMFPIIIATFILKILTLFKIKYMAIIMIVEFTACLWSTLSARAFIIINVHTNKKFIAVIPIAVIYFYLVSHFIFYCYYSQAWAEGADGAKGDDNAQ